MLNVLLIGAGVFIAFAAGGYSVARSVVTSEPYMLATLANASSIKLSSGLLTLELGDPGAKPYWTLDLSHNRPAFQNADALLRSFEGKSLSAENQLLLTFASGGAATTTAASIYKQIIETRKSRDWRTFVATIIGASSGYLAGYYAAMRLAKPSDREIQAALRNPETVEKVKKYVFLSLLERHGFECEQTAGEKVFVADSCSAVEARPTFIECLTKAWQQSGYSERLMYREALLESARRALSNDEVHLNGNEFLLLVLQ